MLPIGIQSRGVINEKALKSGYQRISQSGMSAIDYNIIWSNIEAVETYEVFHKHREIADSYGLKFSQVHGPRYMNLEYPRDLECLIKKTEDSIAVCKILDAPYLVVHPLHMRALVGSERELEYNRAYFLELGKLSKLHGITICIENLFARHGGRIVEGICASAREVVAMIEWVNDTLSGEYLGACFDVGHANALRKDLKSEVLTLGKHLKVLHIHDNNGSDDSHQIPYAFGHSMTGRSTTDWGGFLVALREIGYRGTLSFEPFKALINVPGAFQQQLLVYLREIGRHFSSVICFEDVLYQKRNKKIILFGAGNMLETHLREFGNKYRPQFIVDNNEKYWGTVIKEIEVKDPRAMLEIDEEDRFVIICSGFFEEIQEQLEEMGIGGYILSEEALRMNGKPL